MNKNSIRRLGQLALLVFLWPGVSSATEETLRPPAVPLVACDPYFSIWSQANNLTDAATTHWTGKPQRLTSLVRIDGKTFRLMGKEPSAFPVLPQTHLEVLPTRTIYSFTGEGVRVTLTFMTAALPDDIELLSRPVTYLIYECFATDGQKHELETYFDAASELTVNTPNQRVVWSTEKMDGVRALKVGSKNQAILAQSGDDLRIDWGYLYVATASDQKPVMAAVDSEVGRTTFANAGGLSKMVESPLDGQSAEKSPVSAMIFQFGKVGEQPVARWLMLAYDDLYSIQYMKKNLRPYWRRNGWEAADLLKAAAHDFETLKVRCENFDHELMDDLTKAGDEKYARLAALAYRQCFAAGKFVADENGQPLQFCKENHSNGCISTSDVFYPMSPQFLLFGPSLAKSFIVPFMNYAASERWAFPFAPHDLGTYPQANGQVYGDGERGVNNQMPVEESGNLLCLFGAVAQMEGNADFAGRYWKQLEQWAQYLKEKGFDPENQLCTDDFAGHLAHNVNLSAKAICGLGAFAKMCDLRGDKTQADEYWTLVREFARRWVKTADAGDHFRLAFDQPDSWSQKYNLVWDRILGLNLFPVEVTRKEMAYYKAVQNKYGLPLDNRATYAKLDWITWTATLTQNRADFDDLIGSVYAFLNETPDRSPMTDWYQTKTAKKVGFTARPVVGGVFLQMLYDKSVWQKYARRDQVRAGNWAPIPKVPRVTVVIPAADKQSAKWRYTTSQPGTGWTRIKFDASTWREGWSGFGMRDTPGAVPSTLWNTSDIWLRREVEISADKFKDLELWFHHDDEAEVYINGVLALNAGGFVGRYEYCPLTEQGRAALKPGKNTIAVHCHQTGGGQYVDLGFVNVQTP
ncbi:MAG: Glutaminase [Pedosphaera sp.]|nr:Glutaminase [Pedosphaera sp.]